MQARKIRSKRSGVYLCSGILSGGVSPYNNNRSAARINPELYPQSSLVSMTMAVLFAVAFSQGVDDLLCYEPKQLLCMLGRPEGTDSDLWSKNPDDKSPPPAIAHCAHRARGAWMDFTGIPRSQSSWDLLEQV